jgi:chromosome segregation ATPase
MKPEDLSIKSLQNDKIEKIENENNELKYTIKIISDDRDFNKMLINELKEEKEKLLNKLIDTEKYAAQTIEITNTAQNKMKNYDEIKNLKKSFEIDNNKMKNKIKELLQENQHLTKEVEDNNNEIKNSETNNESQLVARLNGKIANLKHREKQLQDSITQSEKMMNNIVSEHEQQKIKWNNNKKELHLEIDRLKLGKNNKKDIIEDD